MEVDTAPQFGVDTHLDDDLIGYDSEADKEPDLPKTTNRIDEHPPQVNRENEGDEEEYQDVDRSTRDDRQESLPVDVKADNLEETHEGHDSNHEIDYDEDDYSKIQVDSDAAKTGESATTDPHQVMRSSTQDAEEKQVTESLAEDHEISWEHEHEQNIEPAFEESHLSEAKGDDDLAPLDLAFSPAQESLKQEQADEQLGPHSVIGEDSGSHDNEILDGSQEASNTHEAEAVNEKEEDHRDDSDDESQHFPAITVQYKGDEFPCFSANSDGFFCQLSIIDESLKSLLDGFREELVDELLDEDELVFQVDELGLEFSESSSLELLANTTLRQIIDLFDILVKNQDPDDTRTLYTYLSTRPSASKRFDFLMESAAEGKGLDEVIHLFQSPMPGAAGHEGMSIVEDMTQFDEPESADEDQTGESNNVLDSLESSGQEDKANVSDHVLPDRPQHNLDNHVEGTDDIQHLEEELMVSGALVVDDVGTGEEGVDEGLDEGVKEDPFAGTHLPIPADDINDANGLLDYTEIAADATLVAQAEETEVDDVLGLNLDDTAEIMAVNDVGENDAARDEESNPTHHDSGAPAGAADASTRTMTPRDDEDSFPTDFDIIDHDEEAYVVDEAADEEDLGEIDWRDDPETVVDDICADASSNTAKRARGDDENGAEDDQSVKRRRP